MSHRRKATVMLILGTAAALAAAGSGNATSLDSSQSGLNICGPTDHVNVSGKIEKKVPLTYTSDLKAAAPAAVLPFYRINDGGSESCATALDNTFTYFIASTGEVAIAGKSGEALWVKLGSRAAKKLRRAVRHMKPYPRPRELYSVAVNHQAAHDPSSYLRLYRLGTPEKTAPDGISWLQITTSGSSVPSPWSDGRNRLFVAARGHNYLTRDGQIVRINKRIAKAIRRAQSLKSFG